MSTSSHPAAAGSSNIDQASTTFSPALACLALAMLMPSLDTSIANAGLPTLALAFAASFHAVQWVVLAYLLAVTALIVGAARLGDLFGRRRLMLAGIALFTVASALSGLAPSLPVLVAARAAQGLGAAVMMALSVAFIGDAVPKQRSGRAMGLLGSTSALGTTLGPLLGGLLTAGFGWRTMFLINLPLGLITLLLARRYLPADRPTLRTDSQRFDKLGTVLLALSLSAYALALSRGLDAAGPAMAMLLSAAGAGLVLFVRVERRAVAPLVSPALFRDARLASRLAMSLLVSTVLMATLVVGPFHLARGLGLDVARVGLALSVGPLVAALAGVPAGRAVDRHGASLMTIAGLVAIGTGAALLAALPAGFGVPGYLLPLTVITAGYALFQAANNTALLATAQAAERGVVSGLMSLARNLGLITGASLMGAVFALATGAPDLAKASPAAVAQGTRIVFAMAAALIGVALALASGRTGRRVGR